MKAFTLIELLAVIIILAIVALIATPIILDVIEDSKRSADISQVNLIIDAANNYYAHSELTGNEFEEELYGVIPFSGELPDDGSLKIDDDGNVLMAVYIDDVCYNKYIDSNEIFLEENISKESCLNKTKDVKNNFVFEDEPVNGCYNSNENNLCLGSSSKYEDGVINQTTSVGSSHYLSMPFTVDYDKGFTVEYTFKASNLDTNDLNVTYKDIQLMSIISANTKAELVLFYKSDYTKEFSFYSPSSGYLGGKAYTNEGLSFNALELNEKLITLSFVYGDGKVMQYVNGTLNRVVEVSKKTGTENVIWLNSRYNTNQAGIEGEVYSVRINEYPLTESTLHYNYLKDLEKYN